MRQFNFLSKLLEFEPSGSPFISLYLNTEPNETGKKDFEVFLRKQISDHVAVMDEGSSQRDGFEQAAERINSFLGLVKSKARQSLKNIDRG